MTETKLGVLRSVSTSLKDKLAEVLIVAMFLGVGVYLGRDVSGALVGALQSVAQSLGEISKVVEVLAAEVRGQQSLREHEHEELRLSLDECKAMGHQLAECQREAMQ